MEKQYSLRKSKSVLIENCIILLAVVWVLEKTVWCVILFVYKFRQLLALTIVLDNINGRLQSAMSEWHHYCWRKMLRRRESDFDINYAFLLKGFGHWGE